MRRNKITQITLGLALAALVSFGVCLNNAQAFHSDFSCESCHVPHNALADTAAPLWNPAHSTTTLTGKYESTTMDATTSCAGGASKLCLSCHDGTYDHVSDEHSFGPGKDMGPLAQSHPISFTYDDALVTADTLSNGGVPGLVDPDTLPADVLAGGKMECTSCHDVHNTAVPDIEDDPNTANDEAVEFPYLRWEYRSGRGITSAFCRNCHMK